MRVRTDERRNAIIQAATEIFAKVGYERASMAMIAARTGGSKTTLYGYFPSKEELFWAAMTGPMPEQGDQALSLLNPADPDVVSVLRQFGEAYLAIFASRAAIAVTRTGIAESGADRRLGNLLYQRGPKRVLNALANYFSQLKAKNVFGDIDPQIGAVHFKGLLEAGIIEPLLFGTKAEIKPLDAVGMAIDVLLRAYAPSGMRAT